MKSKLLDYLSIGYSLHDACRFAGMSYEDGLAELEKFSDNADFLALRQAASSKAQSAIDVLSKIIAGEFECPKEAAVRVKAAQTMLAIVSKPIEKRAKVTTEDLCDLWQAAASKHSQLHATRIENIRDRVVPDHEAEDVSDNSPVPSLFDSVSDNRSVTPQIDAGSELDASISIDHADTVSPVGAN